METSQEIRVLGAALAEPGIWLSQAQRIKLDLFNRHHALAEQILTMRAEGKETDPQSVSAWLTGCNIKSYPLSELLQIADQSPLSLQAMAQAVDALHEISKRNAITRMATQLIQNVKRPHAKADHLITAAISELSQIAAQSTIGPISFNRILHEVMGGLGRPVQTSVKTGIRTIDAITGGFRPGQLIVVGARPSMGKTALATNFIRQAANVGKSVALFSLEMTAEQIVHRLLADLSRVNLARISTHQLSSAEITALTNAANTAHRYRIWIGEGADNLEPICRQIKDQSGLDMVVIDYLQLMDCRAETREQQIATLSRQIKRLARVVEVPVIVLAQLNRQVESRPNKRPQLSDLRESGAIEQDADMVLLLWRPGYYDREADQTTAELIVAKHRDGPTGLVELKWQAHCARFVDANGK